MAESLVLTTPIQRNSYEVTSFSFRRHAAHLHIQVLGSDGHVLDFDYHGTTATTYMRALNKANGTVKSLERRILEQLLADGNLPAGSIAGTPD